MLFIYSQIANTDYQFPGVCFCGVMVNVMDCGIAVSEFKLLSCYYIHFQTNILGKGMRTPLSSQLWVKLYHYCSSRRMVLALNNLTKVDIPLNKETKSNLAIPII